MASASLSLGDHQSKDRGPAPARGCRSSSRSDPARFCAAALGRAAAPSRHRTRWAATAWPRARRAAAAWAAPGTTRRRRCRRRRACSGRTRARSAPRARTIALQSSRATGDGPPVVEHASSPWRRAAHVDRHGLGVLGLGVVLEAPLAEVAARTEPPRRRRAEAPVRRGSGGAGTRPAEPPQAQERRRRGAGGGAGGEGGRGCRRRRRRDGAGAGAWATQVEVGRLRSLVQQPGAADRQRRPRRVRGR